VSLRNHAPRPREWLCQGGGGHKGGEDHLSALTLSGEGLVETLEAYRKDLGYDRLLKVERLTRELAEVIIHEHELHRSLAYEGLSVLEPVAVIKARKLLRLYSPKGSR